MAKKPAKSSKSAGRAKASGDARDGHCPIVAIGSSAGGVGALQTLLEAMPSDLGVAFVIVSHLEPSLPSELVSILQRKTEMSVVEVADKHALTPNCVYVIPPNRRLAASDGSIASLPFDEPRGQRAPIDQFFRSLADSHGDSFAMVLTGGGSDGVVGVKAIKEAGGLILVQDPAEAEYASMPRSAIATGVADVIAPLRDLPVRLADLVRNKHRIDSQHDDKEDDTALRRILAYLRTRTGHDFSQYKRPTMLRRMTRRLQLNRLTSLAAYDRFLRENPEEVHALFSDLLISVTNFFRDAEAFAALGKIVMPSLFEEARADDPIRVWATGCATGEEAYSLGILLLEEASRRDLRPDIQVFATDLDAAALATAREGRYPTAIGADVSEERLRRFFQKEGDHYRVRKEVRDLIVFAEHSMLKDPPFSRLDLVTCRNLLIYLERDLQVQMCATLRYALKSGGYLFLGSAETADAAPNLFRTVDREHRIYQALPETHRTLPLLPRVPPTPKVDPPRDAHHAAAGPHANLATVHRQALEQSAPPSILVDDKHKILHLSESAGRYLMPAAGPLSSDLTLLARPELRVDIRAGLHRALERDEAGISLAIPVQFNGSPRRVFVQTRPAPRGPDGRRQAIVFFFEGGAMGLAEANPSAEHNEVMRQTQEDLQTTRDRLRVSREEYEAANEELRAANEELQSINEEYRSTAEELETSKEELQSMNEELQTLNSELKIKLEGVSRAHSDLQNLVAATEVGTLFLDPGLRIKRFTPPIADLFNITIGDEGRPITDFTHRLKYDELHADALAVLKDLAPIERELESASGQWFLTRLRPYRTVDDRIDGVVVTFVDVTERKRSEQHLRRLTAELDHRVKNVLARVLALSQMTMGGEDNAALAAFDARVRSMARTHALLSQSRWTGVGLGDIFAGEIDPYDDGGNVHVTGPSVKLTPDAAQAFTLVVHELTTNAAKYGALSSKRGRVEVFTSLGADGELKITWRERDGPPVKAPAQPGYGLGVISDSLAHEFGAKVDLAFQPDGLLCTISVPYGAVRAG